MEIWIDSDCKLEIKPDTDEEKKITSKWHKQIVEHMDKLNLETKE